MPEYFKVVDGDTFDPVTGNRIRLGGGANTPEVDHGQPGQANEPGGLAAAKAAEVALGSGEYKATTNGTGKFGRDLGNLATPDGHDLGAQMLGAGLAVPHINDKFHDSSTGLAPHSEAAAKAMGITTPFEQNPAIRAQVSAARDERIAALDAYFKAGMPGLDSSGAPKQLTGEYAPHGIVNRGLKRGTDNLQATLFGTAQALGNVTGIDVLAEFGEQGVRRNILQAMENPANIASYEDAETLGDWGVMFVEALAEQAPQLAMDLTAAAVSGGTAAALKGFAGIGKAGLRGFGSSLSVATAAKSGAAAAMYAQVAGESQMELNTVGQGEESWSALGLGVLKLGLEYAPLASIMGDVGRSVSRARGVSGDTMLASLRSSAGAVAKGTAKGVAVEGSTEMAQTFLDELNKAFHAEGYEVDAKAIIDAGIKGAMVGGGLRGGGTALGRVIGGADQGYRAGLDPATEPTQDERIDTAIDAPLREALTAGQRATPEVSPSLTAPADTPGAAPDVERQVEVVATDSRGQTVERQSVGATVAEAARAAMQARTPEATIEVVEAPAAEQAAPVQAEQATPKWAPRGLLAEGDVAGTVTRAVELGIDPARFQKTGLGAGVIERARSGLQALVPGNKQKRIDSLASLAEILDVPAAQLTREYYDSRNVINGRELLHQRFAQAVTEKYGGPTEFAKAVDNLPLAEARVIGEALGIKAEGGFDLGALRAEVESRSSDPSQVAPATVDIDSPPDTAEAPRQAQPDRMRDAVMNNVGMRQLLATKSGKPANAVQVDEAIDAMSPGQRLRIEEMLKGMDIDVGGANREQFLTLLEESVAGQAAYGVGRERLDQGDPESASEPVATVEMDTSMLDSADARFVTTVRNTGLTERDRSGQQVGLSTYLLAMSKIIRAGEPEQQSALSAGESTTLNRARVLGGVIDAVIRRDPRIDRGPMLQGVAAAVGVTEELLGKAAGRALALAPAMEQLAKGVDKRAAHALLLQLSRENDMEAGDEANLAATVAALATNPDAAIRGLAHSLQRLYGNEVVEDVALVAFYELNQSGKRDDGTPRRPAFERGGDHSLEPQADPLNEQASSDSQFFGRVAAYTIKGWRLAVLPSAAQLRTLVFDNPLSQAVTAKAAGANLLALPLVDGSLHGRVVDAVALSMYAQAGEHVPSTSAEAAGNLLDNLSRLMAGAQTAHDTLQGVARGVVRNIPDSLVIFVDPTTGEGVTFGKALDSQRRGVGDRLRQTRLQRELDDATDAIDALADTLFDLATDLEQRAPDAKTMPVMAEAITLWRKMIAGETHVTASGNTRFFRKPAREGAGSNKALRSAVDAIGKLAVGEQTLDEAFGEYLGLLGQRKRLAQESSQLASDGAKREAPSEESIVAGKLDVDYDTPNGRRQVEQALRGGQRTAVIAEEADSVDSPVTGEGTTDPEFNAYLRDPLSRASESVMADAEDVLQDARLASLMAQLKGKSQRTLATPMSTTPRPVTATAKQGADRVIDTRFRRMVTLLRDAGVPLPELRVFSGGAQAVEAQLERSGVSPQAAQQVRDSLASGDSFYFVHGGVAHIVIAPREGQHAGARQLADLAHELGHALKDAVWTGLSADERTALENAAQADMVGGVKVDETLLHEWFADQFAKAVVADAPQVTREKGGLVDRVMLSLLNHLRKVWETVVGTPARGNPVFRSFAHELFRGRYANVKRVGPTIESTTREVAGQQASVVRYASGADRLRQARHDQLLKIQAAAFWKKGVVPRLAPVFSMVYSRISRYHADLSSMLFQPAGARSSIAGRSWEQRSRALKGRMMAQVDNLLVDLNEGLPGSKAQRNTAVQAAFEDAYSGTPKTAMGKRVRTLVDNLVVEAERSGLQSVQLGKGFAPVAFDRKSIAARQGEFEKLVAEKLKLAPRETRELVDRILHGPGTLEGVIAPGLPVGAHQTTRQLVEAMGNDQLHTDGWLLRRHDAALFHWVDGISKRSSWEAIFGGPIEGEFEQRGGKAVPKFSPNAKFHKALDEIRAEHGEGAARETMDLVNGALGRHPAGQSMPGWWRSTQEFITGWVGMTVLAFSGIASIPELAMPLVRAGGRVGIGQMFQDLSEARRFARDMGIVLSDSSEQVMWQMTGEQYQSPTISKMQSWFFRLNGNEHIVKMSRTLGTSVGIRFLLNAAANGDTDSLSRLNIDAGTVSAWDAAGRPTWNPDLDPSLQVVSAAVGDAVNQFVNEASLNPSKFQATHWGNNPYMKMIWHLKHFLYTYGDTMLGGIYREMKRRWGHLNPREFNQAVAIAMPALIFAVAVLPLAAASLEARDWVRRMNGQKGKEYEDSLEYFKAIFNRSGGLGPLDFLTNLRQQQEWGMSIWGSFSPVAGKFDSLFSKREAGAKARGLVPIWSQNPKLLGLLN